MGWIRRTPDRSGFWLGGLGLIVLVGAKVHKWLRVGDLLTFSSLAAVVAEDALLFGAIALLLVAVYPRARIFGPIWVHASFVILTTVVVMEHAFFIATGVVGDGYILADGLNRLHELEGLIFLEAGWGGIAALLVGPAVSGGVFWWYRVKVRRLTPKAYFWPAVLMVVGAISIGLTDPEAGNAAVLRRSPLRTLLHDAVLFVFPGLQRAPEVPRSVVSDLAVSAKEGAVPEARNVVVVLLESTSAKATSTYSDVNYPLLPHAPSTTPFLDRLAQRGARVMRAYSTVPHTTKALVGINCGVYPSFGQDSTEARGNGVPTVCLARLLSSQGYRSAFFQPAEEHFESRARLVDEFGFDLFVGQESLDPAGFEESSYFGLEDDAMVEPIVRWAKLQTTPFFLEVLTLAAHHDYRVPRSFPPLDFVHDEELNRFLNTVAYTDRFLQKLYDALDTQGFWENTILVVTGDHGEAFGEHGRRFHDSTVYDEMMRVPLVVVGPGIQRGSQILGARQHVDLQATVLEYLALEPSRPLFGRSLLRPAGRRELVLHTFYREHGRALLWDDYKLINNYSRSGVELYDLAADPTEQHNLASLPGWQEEVKERNARLLTAIGGNQARYYTQSQTRLGGYVTHRLPPVAQRLNVDFGPIVLVGSELSAEEVAPLEPVTITTVYYVRERPPPGLNMFTHIGCSHGGTNADHIPVSGSYPVQDWKPGEYVRDVFELQIRDNAASGRCTIWMGFDGHHGRLRPEGGENDNESRTLVGEFLITAGRATPTSPRRQRSGSGMQSGAGN